VKGIRARIIAVAVCMLLILAGCGGSPAGGGSGPTGDVIKIGVVGPLTGPAAEAGTALRQGAQLALDEWNAKGGIKIGAKQYKVEALFEDDTSKPAVGVTVAEKLITRDKVNFIVGSAFHSDVAMAVMELVPKYKVAMMSWEPVSGSISQKIQDEPQKYGTFWKMTYASSAYGAAVYGTYKYLMDQKLSTPKNKTVAFLVEDTEYGRSNATTAQELFTKDGWKVLTTETVALGYTDFYPQLGKLKNLNPDVLITVFTSLASGVALVKQFKEQGMTASHISIYYPLRPEFIQQAGDAANGLIWVPLSFDPVNNKAQAEFSAKIKAKFNRDANGDHASGYDGMSLALNAIQAAGSLDQQKISDAMAKTDWKGISGRYVFDPKNHTGLSGPEYLAVPAAQIQNGKNVTIWPEQLAVGKFVPQAWVK
jgi:branched-chain amino acid transport system substrate-binding protein